MALEGSLRDFGLADILQLIYFQKKTGILTVSGQMDRIRLMFDGGNIISVDSRKRVEEDRLGKILLKKGLIKEDDLKSSLQEQSTTGERIGVIFLRKGVVAKEEIEETLVSQMTEAVVQLFSWKEGTYEFLSQQVSAGRDISVTLDTQHLLMEGLRIIDEWSLMEGKITLDTVFNRTEMKDPVLTPDDEAVVKFVDGENDVSIIIDLSGGNDFQVSRTLVSLMERGIIEPLKVAPVITEAAIAPAAGWERPSIRFLPLLVFLVAVVLSLMAATIQERGSQKGLAAFLGGDSAKRVSTVRNIDELRFMADAYRYRNGSYPVNLDQIGNSKDVWGRPYLYRVGENEDLIILSAGRDGKVGTEDDIY